ncbi:MAG: tetratricopeptide repeat protein [Cyanobacteria bacterium P01_D01_bin.44]
MERDYYVALPEDYVKTGQRLYQWLDGTDRWLGQLIDGARTRVVLAMAAKARLAHLPWEVLHDGQSFLVARLNPVVVPVRWQGAPLTWADAEVPNRPLQTLFMATSPMGVKPVLDFELEEGRILEATQRQPLTLTVEESGCLDELANLLTSYGEDHFDVVHLTGHAWIADEGPRFITETETGARYDASPQAIAKALQFRFPALMFLSGCRTGQMGHGGEVPSMAAALLEAGANAVLGWGRPVLDTDGIKAAETLYAALAAAKTLPEAVALTYQTMIEAQARDWHLLRLYLTGQIPQNLVTPLKTKKRKRAPKPSMATDFLDAAGTVKVPTRGSFIGRRRPLQACLRALQDPDRVGVLIHGMGGLGKSSLAARLCDRLTDFERVVWVGPLDEAGLVNRLAERVRDRELRQRLQGPNEDLKYRLRTLFEAETEQTFLLVLDDFEANLEAVGKGFRLMSDVAKVLRGLVWAIEETSLGHRIVITCRYDFEFTGLAHFHRHPLAQLQDADLHKKCQQLIAFDDNSSIEESLQERALKLADGNPRLLEWLDKVLQNPKKLQQENIEAVLDKLDNEQIDLREKVLAESLLNLMNKPLRQMLSRALLYELPVPREAIEVVCSDISKVHFLIDQAIALGLLEHSLDGALRVPRVLPLTVLEAENLAGQAARKLVHIWLEADTTRETRLLEIHRLALLGKDQELSLSIALLLSKSWLTKLGRFRETIDICEKTLEIINDTRLLMRIGNAKNMLGLTEDAYVYYQEALEDLNPYEADRKLYLYKKLEINSLLSEVDFQKGNLEQAISRYLECLRISVKLEDKRGQVICYTRLGKIYTELGKADQAFKIYNEALKLLEHDFPLTGRGEIIHEIASSYYAIGEIDNAEKAYNLALSCFRNDGNLLGLKASLHELGRIFIRRNDYDSALGALRESLDFSEKSGDMEGKSKSLHEIGYILSQQGKFKEAIPIFKKVLDIETKIGNLADQVGTLNNIAQAYLARNFTKKSYEYLARSLELINKFEGKFSVKADTFLLLAHTHLNDNSTQPAIDAFESAIDYLQRSGDKSTFAYVSISVGKILHEQLNDLEGALRYFSQSVDILSQLSDPMRFDVSKRIKLIKDQQALH